MDHDPSQAQQSHDGKAWMLMNPFPLPLSSPLSQLVAEMMLIFVVVSLILYVVFFARKRRFFAARAALVNSVNRHWVGRYEYKVSGKVYFRLHFFKSRDLHDGLLSKRNGKGPGGRLKKFVVVYYDPLFPWVSCIGCKFSALALFVMIFSLGVFLLVILKF
ncbi:hypothetical protein [Alloalcanivorax mobilis]|uniref:hypothetical protein n=1 Tax=Alloalcanivorax mobilis TaxID=2019569 RepID=UPI0012FFE5D4|nr:hypothetical protein [Alloalcanivorax mobilis]